jgi:hypothetical protein
MSRDARSTGSGNECTPDPRAFINLLNSSGSEARISITDIVISEEMDRFLVAADVHWVLVEGRQRVAAEYRERFEIANVGGKYVIVSAPFTDGLMCSWISEGKPGSWLAAHPAKRHVSL